MPTEIVIYDGMNYRFDGKNLFDSTGAKVAHLELSNESTYDEYDYYIHEDSGEVMHSQHENEHIEDLGRELAGAYASFNY